MIDIQLNPVTKLRIQRRQLNGHDYVDMRFYYANAQGDYRPSGVGLEVKVEFLDNIIKALKKIKKE